MAFAVGLAPFTPVAIAAVPWAWRQRRQKAVRFCLAWLLPSWLVFELVPTKLPHYVLPLLPALALLAAAALAAPPPSGRWRGPALAVGIAIALGLAAAAVALPWRLEGRLDAAALVAPARTSTRIAAVASAGRSIAGNERRLGRRARTTTASDIRRPRSSLRNCSRITGRSRSGER